MADRKARSVTFRTPERIGLGDLKASIQQQIQDAIVVFQDLGDDVFLLEMESRGDAEVLVNDGFDINLQQPEATDQEATVTETESTHANSDVVNKASPVDSHKVEMEYEDRAQNLKRQHVTDSDSDKSTSVRRPRLKTTPNLLSRKKNRKKSAKASDKPPS